MIIIGQKLYVSATIVAILFGVLLHKNAFVTGSPECLVNEFPCEDGGCVDHEFWCDTHADCDDKSDEMYCRKFGLWWNDSNKCSPLFYFECNDGPCIPLIGRCNGIKNCEDSSDENNCENYNAKKRKQESGFEGLNATKFFISLNSSNNSIHMKVFSGHEFSGFTNRLQNARHWLYSQRRKDSGWGDQTHRAMTALLLSNDQPMVIGTVGDTLVVKQLEIQLFLALLRNGTKPMKLTDLPLYINAILAICKDPKNFYGENLVRALRDRVNAAHKEDTFVNPSVYLSLCINNEATYDDARKLQNIFFNRNGTIGIIEIQSLALMVSACIFQKTDFLNSSIYDSLKMEFLRTVKVHAVSGNLYEAALLVQALREIKVTIEGATDFILKQQKANGSFGDVLSTYLVMPILAGKNMLQIHDHCVPQNLTDFTPSQVLKNEKSRKMLVHYSLNYGFPSDIKQTIQMHVPERTNFLDIMKIAQEINPNYTFKLGENHERTIVYLIGGISNDAEKGMYWVLYKTSRNSSEIANEKYWDPYSGDIKKLILADGDKVLFWYRPLQT